ncbi:hypothetical protein C8D92_108159 [Tamilnaduibacter salinus]|uniref:Polymerase nucleotidyl transferase domain-containing protein n=1 Tax=Tamilnaduibacter salinus TaxID=1484056 RepID=A0A2U1CUP0_9GAMM|nr:nucleotidyltransferase domain-containing protein [Tamilnaduibacter salinus]PVY70802.1 hypothetical protein C8D92_108159 [Tamilnaduibacter salinus]
MRLTNEEQKTIVRIVEKHLGTQAEVSVFGSRVDDSRRGGDLDLYIETADHASVRVRARLKMALENALQLPVDAVFHQKGQSFTPFENIARESAVAIQESGAQ